MAAELFEMGGLQELTCDMLAYEQALNAASPKESATASSYMPYSVSGYITNPGYSSQAYGSNPGSGSYAGGSGSYATGSGSSGSGTGGSRLASGTGYGSNLGSYAARSGSKPGQSGSAGRSVSNNNKSPGRRLRVIRHGASRNNNVVYRPQKRRIILEGQRVRQPRVSPSRKFATCSKVRPAL